MEGTGRMDREPVSGDGAESLDVALVCQNVVRRDGQGRVMLELARAVVSRGHRVTVYAHRLEEELADHVAFRRIPRVPGVQFLDDLVFLLWATMAVGRRAHDVACVLGPTAFPDCPYVFDAQFSHRGWRATWTRRTRPSLYHRVHARAMEALESVCARKAHRVIASTRRLAEEVAPGANAVVVPNGVDAGEFRPDDGTLRARVRARFGIPEDAFVVVLVGGWATARKGVDPLLEAVALGPPDELLLLGATGPRDALARRLASLGVADRVAVAGFEPPQRLFAAADVIAVPSLYEPFSLVALEAVASGVPVVLSRRAGAADVLDGAVLVVDDPQDPAALRKALDRVRAEPELVGRMADAGRQVVEGLGWAGLFARAVDVLEEVAGEGRV